MALENILYPIVLVISFIASVVGIVNIKTGFRDPKRIPVNPPAWWLYSKKGWQRWARAMPLSPIFFMVVIFAGTIVEYGDLSNSAIKTVFILLAFLFFFGFLLGVYIALTGRPKWLIPPHLR
jgi:hypothetical protein